MERFVGFWSRHGSLGVRSRGIHVITVHVHVLAGCHPLLSRGLLPQRCKRITLKGRRVRSDMIQSVSWVLTHIYASFTCSEVHDDIISLSATGSHFHGHGRLGWGRLLYPRRLFKRRTSWCSSQGRALPRRRTRCALLDADPDERKHEHEHRSACYAANHDGHNLRCSQTLERRVYCW